MAWANAKGLPRITTLMRFVPGARSGAAPVEPDPRPDVDGAHAATTIISARRTPARRIRSAELPLVNVPENQRVVGAVIRPDQIAGVRGHIVVEETHERRQLVAHYLHH